MQCRVGCGACCIAPSISSAIPGMPAGKPAGIRCIHLTENHLCGIFNHPDRPQVCADFDAEPSVCGSTRNEALILLTRLEQETC
ncbi:YkgJ family cysteine cluster protein [Pseudidiomarina sp. E22-M8]|uniref:YkgJ family cysteine cluster protein n=1 Tax=Pseudidiomarina sp. E22-M8 TaxID=3424768 RepID=UPI00403C5907